MFIELEFQNEESDEQLDKKQQSGVSIKKNDIMFYNQLESSRKEERRPFSQPFKLDQQNL